MKVYVAKIMYNYEGFEILGIYYSQEGAEEAIKSLPQGYTSDGTEVEEFELGEIKR